MALFFSAATSFLFSVAAAVFFFAVFSASAAESSGERETRCGCPPFFLFFFLMGDFCPVAALSFSPARRLSPPAGERTERTERSSRVGDDGGVL